MSYSRWSEGSDVYVYADIRGGVCCCGCGEKLESRFFYTFESLKEHLLVHRGQGWSVPEYLLDVDTYDAADFERDAAGEP